MCVFFEITVTIASSVALSPDTPCRGSTSFWHDHFVAARFVVALFGVSRFVAGSFWSGPFWREFHKNNFAFSFFNLEKKFFRLFSVVFFLLLFSFSKFSFFF